MIFLKKAILVTSCALSGEHPCPSDGFRCTTSRTCIQSSWHCDRDYDCEDQSDESNCGMIFSLQDCVMSQGANG